MSLSKYQAFVTAAEFKNITKAAEYLGYTQSGLSHLINSLEEELGIALLIRSKAGVHLSAEGDTLLPFIKQVLEADQDIRNKVADLRGLTTGSLRIGTFSSVAIHWLPKILAVFKESYSGIDVSLNNGTYATVEEALLENDVDCAFVTLPSREEFTVYPLMRDRLMVITSPENPISNQKTVRPCDLGDHNFIVPAEGSSYDIGKLLAKANVIPKSILSINDDYAAVAMVRQQLGITILPEMLVRELPMDGLCCVPITNSERQIGIAIRSSRYMSPAMRMFLDIVRKKVGVW